MCSGPGQLKAPVACAADSEQLDPEVAEEQAKMKVCPRAYWSSNQCAGYVLVRVVLECRSPKGHLHDFIYRPQPHGVTSFSSWSHGCEMHLLPQQNAGSRILCACPDFDEP